MTVSIFQETSHQSSESSPISCQKQSTRVVVSFIKTHALLYLTTSIFFDFCAICFMNKLCIILPCDSFYFHGNLTASPTQANLPHCPQETKYPLFPYPLDFYDKCITDKLGLHIFEIYLIQLSPFNNKQRGRTWPWHFKGRQQSYQIAATSLLTFLHLEGITTSL